MTYGLGADASHRGGGLIRRLCAALVAVMVAVLLWVCAAAPLLAQAPQDMGQVLEEAVTGAGDTAGSDGSGSDGSASVAANANAAPVVPSQPVNGVTSSLSSADFAKWEDVAARAQEAIGAAQASDSAMSELRSELATWRARFLTAQGGSANTIETLQAQIAALGPAPAEGETEAEELARQRVTLNARLGEVSAPVKAAEVAYSRADGLIQGIDRILRERQTGALMVLGPSPINPANWPAAAEAVISGSALSLIHI